MSGQQKRIISGFVDAEGNRTSGSGFASEKYNNKTGMYLITYDEPFENIPSVVSSIACPNSKTSTSIPNCGDNSFSFYVGRDEAIILTGEGQNHKPNDYAFSFIVCSNDD